MAKSPKKKAEEGQEKSGQETPISYRPSKAVKAALEDYRNQFDFKPDRTKIIERALRDFLKAKGFDIPEGDE